MPRFRPTRGFLASMTILLARAGYVAGLDWPSCTAFVEDKIQKDPSFMNNTAYFLPASTIHNPLLTLHGCEALCGADYTWYTDWGAILNSWLLPAILLISQLDLRNRKAFFDTPHLLGDPISWFYSANLLIELACRAWRREEMAWDRANPRINSSHAGSRDPEAGLLGAFYSTARKVPCRRCCPPHDDVDFDEKSSRRQSTQSNANIHVPQPDASSDREQENMGESSVRQTAAAEADSSTAREQNQVSLELEPVAIPGSRRDWIRIRATTFMYLETLRGNGGSQQDFWDMLVREADNPLCGHCQRRLMIELAHALSNGRTWHVSNACVALVLYAWQAISSFITVVGGSWSSVPGGRIGLAMFYHFLVTAILLSSTIGSFPTRSFCYRTMETIAAKYGCNLKNALESVCRQDMTDRKGPRDGNGVYRRETRMEPSDGRRHGAFSFKDRPHWFLFLLAALPVVATAVGSIVLLWFLPPKGPNPRLFLLSSIACFFVLSAAITSITRNLRRVSNQAHMWFTLAKDICIGVPSLVLVVLASCGLFNSCHAWSGIWRLHENAYISLNNDESFEINVKKRYPILFCVCIGAQFLVFALIVALGRKGFGLLRWSGTTRNRVLALLEQ